MGRPIKGDFSNIPFNTFQADQFTQLRMFFLKSPHGRQMAIVNIIQCKHQAENTIVIHCQQHAHLIRRERDAIWKIGNRQEHLPSLVLGLVTIGRSKTLFQVFVKRTNI